TVHLNKVGSTITATDSVNSAITSTAAVKVNPGSGNSLSVSGGATAVIGTPATFTVTALDKAGNVATGYTGTVHFTSTDAQAGLPADFTFTSGPGSDNGVHAF